MVAGQSSLSLNSCFRVFVYLFVALLHQTFIDLPLPHSRPAIKKYILANNKSTAATAAVFDSQFNKALRTGVEKGDFTQPKGTVYPPQSPASVVTPPRDVFVASSRLEGALNRLSLVPDLRNFGRHALRALD